MSSTASHSPSRTGTPSTRSPRLNGPPTSPRRPPRQYTHRKKISALRLSSDTTNTMTTLPEYIASPSREYNRFMKDTRTIDARSDPGSRSPPPDYPDSAEEADEDTDSGSETGFPSSRAYSNTQGFGFTPFQAQSARQFNSHHHSQSLGQQLHTQPRPQLQQHRRHHSFRPRSKPSSPLPSSQAFNMPAPPDSVDPYLDSLLERSVQALEMSNALLCENSQSAGGSTYSGSRTGGFGSDYGDAGSRRLSTDFPSSSRLGSIAGYASASASTSDLSRFDSFDSPYTTSTQRMRDTYMRRERERDREPNWAQDLEEINRGVDRLFGESGEVDDDRPHRNVRRRERQESTMSISSSLPNASHFPASLSPHSTASSQRKHRRRPSLDLYQELEHDPGGGSSGPASANGTLRFERQARTHLVAPPPRALTQYIAAGFDANVHQPVEEGGDGEEIVLPSTIGLRSSSHVYSSGLSRPHAHPHPGSVSTPILPLFATHTAEDRKGAGRKAYEMLVGLVGAGSSTPNPNAAAGTSTPPPPPAHGPSFLSTISSTFSGLGSMKRRRSLSGSVERASQGAVLDRTSSLIVNGSHARRSRSQTPKPTGASTTPTANTPTPTTPRVITMTPPLEESSQSSSSEDGGVKAKQTVSALRKILDEQPAPPVIQHRPPDLIRAHKSEVLEASTSTATASISRLFTKGVHSHSSSISRPSKSAMKGASAPATPSGSVPPTPTGGNTPVPGSDDGTRAISPENVPTSPHLHPTYSAGSSANGGFFSLPSLPSLSSLSGSSRPGSGANTPNKRISFAQLPESYASSRPEGSKIFQEKKNRSKRSKRKPYNSLSGSGKGKKKGGSEDEDKESWWLSWLIPQPPSHSASSSTSSSAGHQRHDDRFERFGGGMGGASRGMGGIEDWTV